MPKLPLSDRQQEVVAYLKGYISRKKRAPTLQEVATFFGLKTRQAARYHICQLERKGWLVRSKYVRSMKVKDAKK